MQRTKQIMQLHKISQVKQRYAMRHSFQLGAKFSCDGNGKRDKVYEMQKGILKEVILSYVAQPSRRQLGREGTCSLGKSETKAHLSYRLRLQEDRKG